MLNLFDVFQLVRRELLLLLIRSDQLNINEPLKEVKVKTNVAHLDDEILTEPSKQQQVRAPLGGVGWDSCLQTPACLHVEREGDRQNATLITPLPLAQRRSYLVPSLLHEFSCCSPAVVCWIVLTQRIRAANSVLKQ